VVARLIQIGLAVGVLVVLWRIIGGDETARLLVGAQPGWLVLSFAVLSAQTVLSSIRWQITARPLGINLSPRTALREYYLAQVVNQILPGGVVGDASRMVRSRSQAGLMASAHAVLLERAAGQIAIFAILAAAFGVTLAVPGGLVWPPATAQVISFSIIAVLFLVVVLVRVAPRIPGRIGQGINDLRVSALVAFATPATCWAQIVLSIGTALFNIAGFVFAAWAIGWNFPVAEALALVPVVLFAMLVPFTISGWGVREGAAVALLPLAGATASESLATSITFGLVCIAASLPGLAFVRPASKTPRRNTMPVENTQ
jgi:uncharacterized membrane protein YbhN (UPF0104 family)